MVYGKVRLPAVEASRTPIHELLFPMKLMQVGNVTSAEFVVTPLDGAANVTAVLA
jgi:hypothetical protein